MRALQRSQLVLTVAAIVVILGAIAVFFEAPIIPVTFNGNRPRCAPNGGECTVPVCGWTEWESPSYVLLNLGYHYRVSNSISNCYG